MAKPTDDIETKCVFGISPTGQGDNVPVVVCGIPRLCWERMKDGMTSDFDLTRIGIPVKFVLFGGADHATVKGLIDQLVFQSGGKGILDLRREDFSMKPMKPKAQVQPRIDAKRDDVIQIDPRHHWGGAIAVVNEAKGWGVTAYVLIPHPDGPPQRAMIRLEWNDFVLLGCSLMWTQSPVISK